MLKKQFRLILIITSIEAQGQNLVLNPSLDVFITCPGFGQFSNAYISNWNKPTIASSDYYNYNCPSISPTAQAPYTGEGYAGVIAYNFGTEYREYITGTFSSPLIAGNAYNVEFYASLNDGYIQAIEELGAYISTLAPGPFSNALHINVIPQIENNLVALDDTAQWMKVSGQFVAAGGEQFITIGNFHDDPSTTITQPGSVGSFGAYYFIDAVSVVEDSTTSVNMSDMDLSIYVWSFHNELQIELKNVDDSQFPLLLTGCNALGQNVIEKSLASKSEKIVFDAVGNQIYLFSIMNSEREILFTKKIFIHRNE